MNADDILRVYDGGRRDFSGVNLRGANLHRANLCGADLSWANLCGADLSWANLRGANLCEANLREADLRGANLSGGKGLLDPVAWIANLEQTGNGVICYKIFGQYRISPDAWKIEPGFIIEEIVNPCRTSDCASGINVATLEWLQANCDQDRIVWKCLIRWVWLAGVVVPYNTDGKFRAGRVELIEEVGTVANLREDLYD